MIPAPPVSLEMILLIIACASSVGTAVYMAARRNEKHVTFVMMRELDQAENDNTMDTQLTFEDAIAHRNEVLEAVSDSNTGWLKLALDAMRGVPDGTELTGEKLRLTLLENGLAAPPHVNAWGALTGTLARRGMLVPTGKWEPMREKRSHGRLTRTYLKQTPQSEAA